MAIRKILFVVAAIVALIGASQLVFAGWWLDRMPGMVESSSFYLLGLPGVLFGIVLLIGIMERAVGLRLFLGIVSVISIAGGGVLLVRPEFTRDIVDALLLNRSHFVQVFDMWLVGLIRIAIGIALLYALARPEARMPSGEAERPPEPGAMEQ
jgi:hypothetical protein